MEFHVGQKIDRYIVEGRIGEGGMAEVYKCKHESLNTLHAVKVVKVSKEEIKQRMIREGQLQATLSHNNIVRVTDILPIQGHPCLVMDFIAGQALDDFLYEHRIGLGQAEDIFGQILDAIAYAHDRNIVHRDLKPANILMELHNGVYTPKVADFGLAKALGSEDTGMTRTGVGIGTPAYMAPEQVRNAKGVDHRADIFSLGTILYEMVTAQLPFAGSDTLELLNAVATRPHKDPLELNPNLPPRIVAAINAALIKDPEKRIQSCSDLKAVFKGEKEFRLKPQRFPTLAFDGSDPFTSNYNTVDNIDVPPPESPSLNTIQYNSQDLSDAHSLQNQFDSKEQGASSLPENHLPLQSAASQPSLPPLHHSIPPQQTHASNPQLSNPQLSNPQLSNPNLHPSHASLPVIQQHRSPWMPVIVTAGLVAAIMGYFQLNGDKPEPPAPIKPVAIEEEKEEFVPAPHPFLPLAITASHSNKNVYPQYILDHNPETLWSSSYAKEPTLELQLDTSSQYIRLALELDSSEAEAPKALQVSILDSSNSTIFSKRYSYTPDEDIVVDLTERSAFQKISIGFVADSPSAQIKIQELTLSLDSEQAQNAVTLNRQALDDALEALKKPPKVVKPPPVVAPPPEPEAAPTPPPPPVPTTANVRMRGADSIRLLQGNQSRSIGSVPAGTYTVEATFNGTPYTVNTFTFQAGKSYEIECSAVMKNCKLNP